MRRRACCMGWGFVPAVELLAGDLCCWGVLPAVGGGGIVCRRSVQMSVSVVRGVLSPASLCCAEVCLCRGLGRSALYAGERVGRGAVLYEWGAFADEVMPRGCSAGG